MSGTKAVVNSHTRVASCPPRFSLLWCVITKRKCVAEAEWDSEFSQFSLNLHGIWSQRWSRCQEANVKRMEKKKRNTPTLRKAFFSKWFIKNGGIAEKTQNKIYYCTQNFQLKLSIKWCQQLSEEKNQYSYPFLVKPWGFWRPQPERWPAVRLSLTLLTYCHSHLLQECRVEVL